MLRCGPAATWTAALILSMGSSWASAEGLGFKVAFSNCEEFVGEGPVALAPAQKLVPQGFTVAASSMGQAAIVVRMTRCEAAKVESTRAIPTTLSQIGVNIVSPDGAGMVDTYALIYVTNNQFLAEALDRIGVRTSYEPSMTYEYSRNDAGNGGVLYGAVPHANVAAYFLYGPATEPAPNTQRLLIANWWHGAGDSARVRLQTTFPAVSFGASNVTLYTSKFSALGQLIGGNVYGNFSMVALRGVYAGAEMIVTDSRR